MKKIIGILGVAVIAATMFFSANAVSDSSTDVTLASLTTINNANAEWCYGSSFNVTSIYGGIRCTQGGSSCCPIL